jgi:hypothetical protein
LVVDWKLRRNRARNCEGFQVDIFYLDRSSLVTIAASGPAGSVSNRKELADLGILVTLLALSSHRRSLPKPFLSGEWTANQKDEFHLSKYLPCAMPLTVRRGDLKTARNLKVTSRSNCLIAC